MAAKKQAVSYSTPEYIACCFVGCPTSATIRTRTKTGWANVCVEHDKAIVQKRADAYCASLGLDTTEKKRAYVLQMVRGMKRKFTPPDMREPGQDDEEREAEIAI